MEVPPDRGRPPEFIQLLERRSARIAERSRGWRLEPVADRGVRSVAAPGVVADDAETLLFGTANQLSERAAERPKQLVFVGSRREEETHPVARWLDLLDLAEAHRLDQRGVAGRG